MFYGWSALAQRFSRDVHQTERNHFIANNGSHFRRGEFVFIKDGCVMVVEKDEIMQSDLFTGSPFPVAHSRMPQNLEPFSCNIQAGRASSDDII